MKYRHREIEIELERALKAFPAVLVTGSRQVGKTTLLKEFLKGYGYVSFDQYVNLEGVRADPGLFLAQNPPPVIFDEVQYVPDIFQWIKGDIDEKRDQYGRYAMTGSQVFPLMKGVSESLAGRIAVFELYPFSWGELGIKPSVENTLERMVLGFYPETLRSKELSHLRWFDSFLMTYIERDVRNVRSSINISVFQRFLRLLAARAGQLLNVSEIAKELGISQPTASDWLEILEATYIIRLLKPYHTNVSKRHVKSSKVYFVDSGLLCFLLGLHSAEELNRSPFLGHVFENMVIMEMVKRASASAYPHQFYFHRSLKGVEVDLLIETRGHLDAYEIKWTQTPQRSMAGGLKALSNDLPLRRCAILAPVQSSFPVAEGILAMPWHASLF